MNKKKIRTVIGIAAALGLGFLLYNQTLPNAYVPADDEIALQIRFDIKEDIGLLVYDCCAGGHACSGGTSNADGSLIRHDSNIIVGLEKEALNNPADPAVLSMQFRIITEYVTPNYENVYPEDITKYVEPISWEAHFGESYLITITGDKTNGYQAVLNE